MEGDVIKSFLVGLGFGVDDASLAKFNKAISSASVKVAALYGGIQLAAAGIFASLSKMSEGFEDVGYQLRLVAPAINKFLILRQAMISAYTAAGINLTKAVQQSILFNYSLAKTKFALEAIYKSVGIKFLPMLTKQMDIFRNKIFANMPKIQELLTGFVNGIFKAFSATIVLGSRAWSILEKVWDFFKRLDEATGGWSTKVLGLIAVWKALNLGFLATPLGLILTGLLAILALYDDFKVWQEGGQALINWGSDATKTVLGMIAGVTALSVAIFAVNAGLNAFALAFEIVSASGLRAALVTGALKTVLIAYEAVQWAVNAAMAANPIGLVIAGVAALIGLLTLLDSKWNIFGGHVSGFFSGIGGKIVDFASGAHAATNVAGVTNPQPLVSPGAGSVQKVNQDTTIVVQGTADANANAKAVASEQGRVNFDMTRNLRGAMR